MEDERVLLDHDHVATDIGEAELAEIAAIEANATGGGIELPDEQVRRWWTCLRRSHPRSRHTRPPES
jgi:hypothetical protein